MAIYELTAREVNVLLRMVGSAPGQAANVGDGYQRQWLFRHFEFTEEEKERVAYTEHPTRDGQWQFSFLPNVGLERALSKRQIAKLQMLFEEARRVYTVQTCAEIDALATRLGWWSLPEAEWEEDDAKHS